MPDDAAIEQLLARARAEHLTYRHALADGPRRGGVADPAAARAAIQRAYDLRLEAEALDPTVTAAPFRSEPEKFTHSAVMAFYRQQLGLGD